MSDPERLRNDWIRRYNRLEAAVRRHMDAKGEYTDEADDALHAAFRAVMKDAGPHAVRREPSKQRASS